MIQKYISIIFKIIRKLINILIYKIDFLICLGMFYVQNVKHESFRSRGLPYISVARNGKCTIGKHFLMNNGLKGNPIGRPQRCLLFVCNFATLTIGEKVGISSTAIIASLSITIGDNVQIGGGVCIYDTDFHSLDHNYRKDMAQDNIHQVKSAILIKENSFIGAHSTILKGVTIGVNSIVGACSVVTKSIPDNEIWAGNPAKFIRKINESEEV